MSRFFLVGAIVLNLSLVIQGLFISASASEKSSCADYALGEARRFSLTDGIGAHYTVQRSGLNQFAVIVNLNFGSASGWMRKRVDSCLERINQIGLGSDQTQIYLQLYDPQYNWVPAPQAVNIEVHDKLFRVNSSNYDKTMECETFVHEMLHVAGLVDEYEEKEKAFDKTWIWASLSERGAEAGKPAAYDCRSRSDSVMGDLGSLSLEDVNYVAVPYDLNCACPKSVTEDKCAWLVAESIEVSHHQTLSGCPVPMERIYGDPVKGLIFPQGKTQKDYGQVYLMSTFEPQQTPLRPAHIRRLLWPECKEKNSVYEACTFNAYQTSKSHNGGGCFNSPPVCREFNTWLN